MTFKPDVNKGDDDREEGARLGPSIRPSEQPSDEGGGINDAKLNSKVRDQLSESPLTVGSKKEDHLELDSTGLKFVDAENVTRAELNKNTLTLGPKSSDRLIVDGTSLSFVDSRGITRSELSGTKLTLGNTDSSYVEVDPNATNDGLAMYSGDGTLTIHLDTAGNAFFENQIEISSSGEITNADEKFKIDSGAIKAFENFNKTAGASSQWGLQFINVNGNLAASLEQAGTTLFYYGDNIGEHRFMDAEVVATSDAFLRGSVRLEMPSIVDNASADQIDFASINGGIAIVFRNPLSGQPSTSAVESLLGANESMLYAYDAGTGDTDLGWSETDGSGNLASQLSTF